jgi:outer membrane protein OmpA-like peptidoglycan-associated protein
MKNVIAVLCMLALVVSLSACASYDTKGMVVMTAPCTVEVVVIEQAKVVRITDSVMFDWDSDKIRDDQKPVLDDIASMMEEYPDTLIVLKGFASEEGAKDYNLDLSNRRGEAVQGALHERGVAPSKIQGVTGLGETVEFGELLELNRRVLVITVN